MNKWLLLALDGFVIYGFIESVRWLLMTMKLPAREIVKIVGLYRQHQTLEELEQRASYSKQHSLPIVVILMAIIAISVTVQTVKAFFR
jgi:hypothetical protein